MLGFSVVAITGVLGVTVLVDGGVVSSCVVMTTMVVNILVLMVVVGSMKGGVLVVDGCILVVDTWTVMPPMNATERQKR